MRKRPKYTEGMNEIRRLLDRVGRLSDNYDKDMTLWFILTGLRGPDNGNDNVKQYSTARLRYHLCPRLAEVSGSDFVRGELHPINPLTRGVEGHFVNHFNLAVQHFGYLKGKK